MAFACCMQINNPGAPCDWLILVHHLRLGQKFYSALAFIFFTLNACILHSKQRTSSLDETINPGKWLQSFFLIFLGWEWLAWAPYPALKRNIFFLLLPIYFFLGLHQVAPNMHPLLVVMRCNPYAWSCACIMQNAFCCIQQVCTCKTVTKYLAPNIKLYNRNKSSQTKQGQSYLLKELILLCKVAVLSLLIASTSGKRGWCRSGLHNTPINFPKTDVTQCIDAGRIKSK